MSETLDVGIAGERALTELYRNLGTLGQIEAAFGSSGASRESCSANATLIMEQISANPFKMGRMSVMSKGSFFSKPQPMPMSPREIIDEVLRWLEGPNAVYMNIANDHHFVTVPVSGNSVGIVQAFQGSYSLPDWFDWRGFGVLYKAQFRSALTDLLTSGNASTWQAAARTLFSFDLATRTPANTTKSKAQVALDIDAWFGIKPYVKCYGYKPL